MSRLRNYFRIDTIHYILTNEFNIDISKEELRELLNDNTVLKRINKDFEELEKKRDYKKYLN